MFIIIFILCWLLIGAISILLMWKLQEGTICMPRKLLLICSLGGGLTVLGCLVGLFEYIGKSAWWDKPICKAKK